MAQLGKKKKTKLEKIHENARLYLSRFGKTELEQADAVHKRAIDFISKTRGLHRSGLESYLLIEKEIELMIKSVDKTDEKQYNEFLKQLNEATESIPAGDRIELSRHFGFDKLTKKLERTYRDHLDEGDIVDAMRGLEHDYKFARFVYECVGHKIMPENGD
jgi:hypothetical protein